MVYNRSSGPWAIVCAQGDCRVQGWLSDPAVLLLRMRSSVRSIAAMTDSHASMSEKCAEGRHDQD